MKPFVVVLFILKKWWQRIWFAVLQQPWTTKYFFFAFFLRRSLTPIDLFATNNYNWKKMHDLFKPSSDHSLSPFLFLSPSFLQSSDSGILLQTKNNSLNRGQMWPAGAPNSDLKCQVNWCNNRPLNELNIDVCPWVL